MKQVDPVILIADDSDDNRYTVERRLKREGYTKHISVENGIEALRVLQEHTVDLVLLDIMMPELTGYQVLERMKEDEKLRHIPVIMISAIDEVESVVRCIELGAEDYLPKPFNPTLLRARVGACLEKKRLRDETARQLKVIRKIFGKYVPDSLVDDIVSTDGALEPVQRCATILYSDIASFTSITEKVTPSHLVNILNAYFPALAEPIARHGGIVSQYHGDGMLVTFNIPLEDSEHADKALRTALEIQKIVQTRTFAGVHLATRIGIDTGDVIAGNVGSGERISYTVYGDPVNTASRLEKLNKEYGTGILVSEATVSLLSGAYPLAPVGRVPIRGKTEPLALHKVVRHGEG